jgi:hypothetical protein
MGSWRAGRAGRFYGWTAIPRCAALAAAGEMPTLARMLAGGTRAPVRNPFGLFVGSVWPTLVTGLRADRHNSIAGMKSISPAYERRLTQLPRIHPFWKSVMMPDGKSPCSMCRCPCRSADRRLHVAEWGNHDRHFGPYVATGRGRDRVNIRPASDPRHSRARSPSLQPTIMCIAPRCTDAGRGRRVSKEPAAGWPPSALVSDQLARGG